MVADFAADWNEHGAGVLERVRMTDPATYLRGGSAGAEGAECRGGTGNRVPAKFNACGCHSLHPTSQLECEQSTAQNAGLGRA